MPCPVSRRAYLLGARASLFQPIPILLRRRDAEVCPGVREVVDDHHHDPVVHVEPSRKRRVVHERMLEDEHDGGCQDGELHAEC